MIVLHFFLISLGLERREEQREEENQETEQAGGEDNDQQAQTTGDESRKDNHLMHDSDCVCKMVPRRSLTK